MNEPLPSLLIAYPWLNAFTKVRERIAFRSWVLDSGAYSALTSGTVVDLHEYTDRAGTLLGADPTLEVVFALDVIGDPEASAKNAEYMWGQGVPAVPTFHFGSAWPYLIALTKAADTGCGRQVGGRVALGGLVQRGSGGHGTKLGWAERKRFCIKAFAYVWPRWVHGFGCSDRRLLAQFPFCSTDSTTWRYGVSRYGATQYFGPGCVPERKGNASHAVAFKAALGVQLQWYLGLEAEVRGRFGRVLGGLGLPPYQIRLAASDPEIRFLAGLD